MRRFPVADGTGKGYLATPDPTTATGFGVLVVHGWWGLNRFLRHSCDRLTQSGYVVFAPDLYGGNVARTIDEAKVLRKLLQQLQREALAATLSGALAFLRAQRQVLSPRVGLLGISMGGNFAMRLSVTQPKDIAAVIAIYGISLSKFERSEAAYQIHLAEHDRFEPAQNGARLQERLNAARRPSELYTYPGTSHWFFEDDRPDAYNRAAAERVWTRSLRYLKKVLKTKSVHA
jgi:carboxymethylenebutenolidase